MTHSKLVLKNILSKYPALDHFTSSLRNLIPEHNRTKGNSEPAYPVHILNRNLHILESHLDLSSLHNLSVAEIGPGDSLTIGILMLLIGFNSYSAFDAFPYATIDTSFEYASASLKYLKSHTKSSFTYLQKNLKSYDSSVSKYLLPLKHLSNEPSILQETYPKLHYTAPYSFSQLSKSSFHIIFSQACLEHISDLDSFFAAAYNSLMPGGVFLTQIDFKSHARSLLWNGHYRYSEKQLSYINSKNTFRWINGHPPSHYLNLAQQVGFSVLYQYIHTEQSSFTIDNVNSRYHSFDNTDLTTSSMTVLLQKV